MLLRMFTNLMFSLSNCKSLFMFLSKMSNSTMKIPISLKN